MTEPKEHTRDTLHTGYWRALVSYVGTGLVGFQKQGALPSVQKSLEEVLSRIDDQNVEIVGAGRTDAGVHARAQSICFSMNRPRSIYQLTKALNGLLPEHIGIHHLKPSHPDFHPKRHAIGKCYRYRLHLGYERDPFIAPYAWHIHKYPNVSLMRTAAESLIGEHDFESFRSSACQATHARRFIWRIDIEQPTEHTLTIDVRGNAFCHNMVRIIAGSLLDVGLGKMTLEAFSAGKIALDRTKMGKTAPAHGLTLQKVFYPDDLEDAYIPTDVSFPRYPVTPESWPFD